MEENANLGQLVQHKSVSEVYMKSSGSQPAWGAVRGQQPSNPKTRTLSWFGIIGYNDFSALRGKTRDFLEFLIISGIHHFIHTCVRGSC